MEGDRKTKSARAYSGQLSRRGFLGTVAGVVAASTLPATATRAQTIDPGDESGAVIDVAIIGAGLAGLTPMTAPR